MQHLKSSGPLYSSARHRFIIMAFWTTLPLLGGLIALNFLTIRRTIQSHGSRATSAVMPQEALDELGPPTRHGSSMQPQGRNNMAAAGLELSIDEPDKTTAAETRRTIFRSFNAERAKVFFEPNAFFSLQDKLDESFLARLGQELQNIDAIDLPAGPMAFAAHQPQAVLKRLETLDMLALVAEFGRDTKQQQAALLALSDFIRSDLDVGLTGAARAAMLGDRYEAMAAVAHLDGALAASVYRAKLESPEGSLLQEALTESTREVAQTTSLSPSAQ